MKYTIISRGVPRSEFFQSLRGDCLSVVTERPGPNGLGGEMKSFDAKKCAHVQRRLRAGAMVVFLDAGRAYAIQWGGAA